jgi:hypothetical protein
MSDELKYIPNMPIPDILNETVDDSSIVDSVNPKIMHASSKPLVGSLSAEERHSIREEINEMWGKPKAQYDKLYRSKLLQAASLEELEKEIQKYSYRGWVTEGNILDSSYSTIEAKLNASEFESDGAMPFTQLKQRRVPNFSQKIHNNGTHLKTTDRVTLEHSDVNEKEGTLLCIVRDEVFCTVTYLTQTYLMDAFTKTKVRPDNLNQIAKFRYDYGTEDVDHAITLTLSLDNFFNQRLFLNASPYDETLPSLIETIVNDHIRKLTERN